MPKIIPGVVLHQASVQLEELPRPGDHLETGHPLACHAVADHIDAASIGGDIPTDLR